jgi:hypothetical protein
MGVFRRVGQVILACGAWALALGAPGCSLFFIQPIRIVAWSPAVEHPPLAGGVQVWVEFSAPVDKTKAEAAFALKEGSAVMAGSFAWQGNRMSFQPIEPISAGKDYEMTVSNTVENDLGVSLEADFHFDFSTKSGTTRPAVASFTPANHAVIDDLNTAIVVVFSEKVDAPSFYRAFSVSPRVEGIFAWSADGATCTFTPIRPYAWQTEYLVTIEGQLTDADGNSLPEDFSSRFYVGSESIPPAVIGVRNMVGGSAGSELIDPDDPSDALLTVKESWECTWGIEVRFSEPVLRDSLESYLVFSPGWRYTIESPSISSDRYVLEPSERLLFDTVYTLTVRQGVTDEQGNKTPADTIYRFRTNGEASRPPAAARLRFRRNPADPPASASYAEYAQQDAFLSLDLAAFPVGSTVPTYIDLYFSLAQGAGINLMSLMEAFSVSTTNGCAAIAITAMQVSGFADPQPAPVSGATPVRIHLDISNGVASGLVTWKLSGELIDSASNPIAAPWQLPLLK